MSEYAVKAKFNSAKATSDIYQLIKRRFGGVTHNFRLYANLAETWFGKFEYVGEFVPYKTGALSKSGWFNRHEKRYIWDPVDKYGHHYGMVQWTGDNGSGVPPTKWKRANNKDHRGHHKWDEWAERYRWRKFIKDYATPVIIEAMKDGRLKSGR